MSYIFVINFDCISITPKSEFAIAYIVMLHFCCHAKLHTS